MGRQIQFYMLPKDQDAFLTFARKYNPIELIARDASSSEIETVADSDQDGSKTLCLWNRAILSSLKRKWIAESGYYRVDESEKPVLEFTPSLVTKWEGKPGLIQSRLYGIFDGKSPKFEKWFESLARWIRQNFRKNIFYTGGYVGPAAHSFYEQGGYLLPSFLPPRTDVWLAEIGKQHAKSRSSPDR